MATVMSSPLASCAMGVEPFFPSDAQPSIRLARKLSTHGTETDHPALTESTDLRKKPVAAGARLLPHLRSFARRQQRPSVRSDGIALPPHAAAQAHHGSAHATLSTRPSSLSTPPPPIRCASVSASTTTLRKRSAQKVPTVPCFSLYQKVKRVLHLPHKNRDVPHPRLQSGGGYPRRKALLFFRITSKSSASNPSDAHFFRTVERPKPPHQPRIIQLLRLLRIQAHEDMKVIAHKAKRPHPPPPANAACERIIWRMASIASPSISLRFCTTREVGQRCWLSESDTAGDFPSPIYEVLTFYHYFKLVPPGQHDLIVCNGTACYLKDREALGRAGNALGYPGWRYNGRTGFSHIETVRCIGCCGMSPAMIVDGKTVLGNSVLRMWSV